MNEKDHYCMNNVQDASNKTSALIRQFQEKSFKSVLPDIAHFVQKVTVNP